MNKVVTLEMLAGDLPLAIRGDIDPAHPVQVTVRDLVETEDRPGAGRFSRHFRHARANFGNLDDVVEHVRQVRDGEP